MRTPSEIKKAHFGLAQFFNEFDAHPSRNPQVLWTITHAEIEHVRALRTATAPLMNEELAGIMADYCIDVLKVETDRAQVVASYMRDMESTDGHSHGRMMRYLADRLFGKVKL
jgi:hypothetical protein